MSETAMVSTPSSERHTHLTARQHAELRMLVTQQRRAYRDRTTMAAAALDDWASDESIDDREVARDTLQSLLDGLREHEETLERFDAGTYGECSSCTRPIPYERLEAIPVVNHCMRCVHIG